MHLVLKAGPASAPSAPCPAAPPPCRTPRLHGFVRERVCKQLATEPQRYSGFVPGGYQQYCADMARSGTWGDHVTLQVWAGELGRHAARPMGSLRAAHPGLLLPSEASCTSMPARWARPAGRRRPLWPAHLCARLLPLLGGAVDRPAGAAQPPRAVAELLGGGGRTGACAAGASPLSQPQGNSLHRVPCIPSTCSPQMHAWVSLSKDHSAPSACLQVHYNSLYPESEPPPPLPDDKLLGSRRLHSLLFGPRFLV